FDRDEEIRGAEGLADGLAGVVDEEKLTQGRAYSETLSQGRAQHAWFTGVSRIKTGLDDLLDAQADTNPLKREAEVAAYLENSFREIALDPETGEIDPRLTPKSRGWLGQQMGQLRPQLVAQAQEAMRKRMDDESGANA